MAHERALAKLGNCSKINASMLRALGHHGTSSSHELLLCLVQISSNPSGLFFDDTGGAKMSQRQAHEVRTCRGQLLEDFEEVDLVDIDGLDRLED